jgi:hypothetical protein
MDLMRLLFIVTKKYSKCAYKDDGIVGKVVLRMAEYVLKQGINDNEIIIGLKII